MRKVLVMLEILIFSCVLLFGSVTFGLSLNWDNISGQTVFDLKELAFYTYTAGIKVCEMTKATDTTAVDTSKGLESPQLSFLVSSKNIYGFALGFRFGMMVADDPSNEYLGAYKARIYKPLFANASSANSNFRDRANLTLSETMDSSDVLVSIDTSDGEEFHTVIYAPKTEGGVLDGSTKGLYDNGREIWTFPISFDFSDYLPYYPGGDYTGTITVGVYSI